jgi:hypothetical protein
MRLSRAPLAFLLFACSSFVSPVETASDAGRDAGAGSDDAQVPPANAIYVSTSSGNDSSDGLTQKTAVKTLGAAFALIETKNLAKYAVVACRGIYEEPRLVSRKAIALQGGYNCSTWTRADTFGKKGGFNDPNETRIIGNASDDALFVSLEAGSSFTLEGVTVEAHAGNTKAAVRMNGPGRVVVSNVRAYGAGALDKKPIAGATHGLQIANAEVEIKESEFYGGAGDSSTPPMQGVGSRGSIGLELLICSGDVGTSLIDAGTGKGWFASLGLIVGSDKKVVLAPLVIHDVSIRGTGATGVALGDALPWAFTGVYSASQSKQTFANLEIRGGEAKYQAGAVRVGVLGMNLNEGDFVIQNSRINPGRFEFAGPLPFAYCEGVVANTLTSSTVTNSAIVADCDDPLTTTSSSVGYQAFGGTTSIRHSTIISLGRPGSGVNTSAFFNVLGNKATLENNVLGAMNGSAFNVYSCQGAELTRFRANALWSATPLSVLKDKPPGMCNEWVPTDLKTFGRDTTSVTILPSSLAGILEPSDPSMFAEALRSGAIRPSATASGCALSRGGVDLLAQVPTDIEGKPRSPRPALGAWEAVNPMCP